MNKHTYKFGNFSAEGNKSMVDVLGGKGANLAEMSKIGMPVPPGFTITTSVYPLYMNKSQIPKEVKEEIEEAISWVETLLNKKLGCDKNPLLVSVRSGSAISMPGMLDTILNLGLNDVTVQALADITGDERFAFDNYRRFIQMYGSTVYGINSSEFDNVILKIKKKNNFTSDYQISIEDIKEAIKIFKDIIYKEKGCEIPSDVFEQLYGAIGAVFDSWMNKRAISYREIHGIKDTIATAVTVQSMVFGNRNDNSGTGVVFTRNPSNGDKSIFGEYLLNAQGEDVVSGIRTPLPLISTEDSEENENSLQHVMPKIMDTLIDVCNTLEQYHKDMQDIEFTIEDGRLWILQTRSAKRTPYASIKVAVDMVKEELISKQEALLRINPEDLSALLHPSMDDSYPRKVLAKGLPASPGASSGTVVFSSERAKEEASMGNKVLLVTDETTPEDIDGMVSSVGIVTARGGMTSHAAVVARGMGKPCVCGVRDISVDEAAECFSVGDLIIREGDYITINGTSGEVIQGEIPTLECVLDEEFYTIMEWAGECKRLKVRANADTVKDIKNSLLFGAEGVGLCRTEHMFFNEDRILAVRKMIVLDGEDREEVLSEVMKMQTEDFYNIFEIIKDRKINIRLLDPPLHEFLPSSDEAIEKLSKSLNLPEYVVRNKIKNLREVNPMLGHRGCRIGISSPEIYEMQIQAIFTAAAKIIKKSQDSKIPDLEIMVPFVSSSKEFKIIKNCIYKISSAVLRDYNADFNFAIGTMLELPRAILRASDLVEESEFFCFGTNDLTQTVFGISRDDFDTFMGSYIDNGILSDDPFAVIDREGVGEIMKIAIDKVRSKGHTNSFSVCGEHGGNPKSIEFFDSLDLEYISCSPFRVPIAILAAAQSSIKRNTNNDSKD